MKYLAIIPARAGSKRIPNKNKVLFNGKPLVSWSIEAALKCDKIDNVCVSTDDKEIVEIAKNYGVKYIERSEILSTDTVKSSEVIFDVIKRSDPFVNLILLQPTSPLRTTQDIVDSIDLYEAKDANSVVSVCEIEHPYHWQNKLKKNLSMEYFVDSLKSNKRSQDFEKFYRLNGAIYIVKTEVFLEKKVFLFKEKCYGFIMPQERSVDIDTYFDLRFASFLMTEQVYEN